MSQMPIIDTPENWDAASTGYAENIAPVLMEKYADEFVDLLELEDDSKVLEVACGSGAITETLARHSGSLLAVDFAPKMVEITRERLANAGVSNTEFAVMDGQALDLEDNSFDAALCSFALMLFPDRAKGFAELKRVVKPSGKVVVSGWAGPDKFGAFELFMTAMKKAFPNMPPPPSPPPVFSLSNPESFKAEMEAAGFSNVEIQPIAHTMTLPDFDMVWKTLTIGAPPVKMMFDMVGEEGKEALKQALREVVTEKFGDGPIVTSNTAMVGTGVA